MILDSLPQPHLMLARLSILSIRHEILVLQDLSMVAAADALLAHHIARGLLIVLGVGKARHFAKQASRWYVGGTKRSKRAGQPKQVENRGKVKGLYMG